MHLARGVGQADDQLRMKDDNDLATVAGVGSAKEGLVCFGFYLKPTQGLIKTDN